MDTEKKYTLELTAAEALVVYYTFRRPDDYSAKGCIGDGGVRLMNSWASRRDIGAIDAKLLSRLHSGIGPKAYNAGLVSLTSFDAPLREALVPKLPPKMITVKGQEFSEDTVAEALRKLTDSLED